MDSTTCTPTRTMGCISSVPEPTVDIVQPAPRPEHHNAYVSPQPSRIFLPSEAAQTKNIEWARVNTPVQPSQISLPSEAAQIKSVKVYTLHEYTELMAWGQQKPSVPIPARPTHLLPTLYSTPAHPTYNVAPPTIPEIAVPIPPTIPERASLPSDELTCKICMEAKCNIAFLCGHSTCTICANELHTCHICRALITHRIKMYW